MKWTALRYISINHITNETTRSQRTTYDQRCLRGQDRGCDSKPHQREQERLTISDIVWRWIGVNRNPPRHMNSQHDAITYCARVFLISRSLYTTTLKKIKSTTVQVQIWRIFRYSIYQYLGACSNYYLCTLNVDASELQTRNVIQIANIKPLSIAETLQGAQNSPKTNLPNDCNMKWRLSLEENDAKAMHILGTDSIIADALRIAMPSSIMNQKPKWRTKRASQWLTKWQHS